MPNRPRLPDSNMGDYTIRVAEIPVVMPLQTPATLTATTEEKEPTVEPEAVAKPVKGDKKINEKKLGQFISIPKSIAEKLFKREMRVISRPSPFPSDVVVPAAQFRRIRLFLNRAKTKYEIQPTIHKIISRLRIDQESEIGAKPEKDCHITITGWNGEMPAAAFEVLCGTYLVPLLKRDIVVTVPHGRFSPPLPQQPGFVVHVWGGPKPRLRGALPHYIHGTAWGLSVNCTTEGEFALDPMFASLITPEGNTLASWNGDNLYLHWDAIHYANSYSSDLLKEVFKRFADCHKNKSTDTTMRSGVIAYIRHRDAGLEERIKHLSRDVERTEGELLGLRGHLAETYSLWQQSKHTLIAMTEYYNQSAEKFAKASLEEWLAIMRIPDVLSVALDVTGQLIVLTTTLFTMDKHKQHYLLGRFAIQENYRAAGGIQLENFSVPRNEIPAPHAYGDGGVCFGTMEIPVQNLLLTKQYPALMQLIIAFLTSPPNLSDPLGRNIERFKKITAEEMKIIQKEDQLLKQIIMTEIQHSGVCEDPVSKIMGGEMPKRELKKRKR